MLQKIRRVVTGHNSQKRSVIVEDSPSPHALILSNNPAFGLTNLWVTHNIPANNEIGLEAIGQVIQTPPKNGSIFRMVEFPPEKELAGKIDRGAAFRAMSAHDTLDRDHSRHPLMHKTNTIDYAVIIAGEIYAVLDEEETLLHAGDCLIQRGTNHAWSNRSEEPCLVAFILIDAKPIEC